MNTVKTGFFSSRVRSIRVYFNCYYYARDRTKNKVEILDIEDKLSMSFLEPLLIKDRCAVYVDDLEFEKVENGILNCSFNFEIGTEFIDESNVETIEKIKKFIDERKESVVFYIELFTQFKELLNRTSNINNYHFLHGGIES